MMGIGDQLIAPTVGLGQRQAKDCDDQPGDRPGNERKRRQHQQAPLAAAVHIGTPAHAANST